MLNDCDVWTVTCPDCGNEMKEEIGRLKDTDEIKCDRCGAELMFQKDAFLNRVDQLRQMVASLAQTDRFATKPGS